MDKLHLKLLPFAVFSVLATVGIANGKLVILCYLVALFSCFLIDMAANKAVSVGVNLAVLVTATLFGNFAYTIILGILIVLVAGVLSGTIKRSADFGITMVSGAGTFSAGFAVIDVLLRTSSTGNGLFYIFGTLVDKASAVVVNMFNSIPEASQLPKDEINLLLSGINELASGIKVLLPGIIVIAGIFSCLVVLLVSRFFIGGMPVPRLSRIKVPRAIVYGFCVLYIVQGFISGEELAAVFSNVVLVLTFIMIIGGFSVIKYFTEKIKPSPLSWFVFVFLIPVCVSLNTVLTFLGMADGVFRFRRFEDEKR